MPKQKLLPKSMSKMIRIGVDRPSELERYRLSRTDDENQLYYAEQMQKWEVARLDSVAEMQMRLEHISRNFFGLPERFTGSLEGKAMVLWMIAREFLPGLRTSELRRRRTSKARNMPPHKRWTPDSLKALHVAVVALKGRNPKLSDVAACRILITQCKKDPNLFALKPLILGGGSISTTEEKRTRTLSNAVSRARKQAGSTLI